MSQESGLGTFRGPGGLWERFRPEDLATPQAFARDPERVSRWYLDRLDNMRAAQPNPGHCAIARWPELFSSLVVVTQNIDGLHQRAGSRGVLELHGTIWRWRCAHCSGTRGAEELIDAAVLPIACDCGGWLRPDVVWFGEPLPLEVFERAAAACAGADLFIAVGTSATVWPAAGLIDVAAAAGALVVEVNREPTPLSAGAGLHLRGGAGELLPRMEEEMRAWRSPA